MDIDKEEFLKESVRITVPNGPKKIDEIRATEFKRLDGQNFPFYSRLEIIQSCSLFGSHEMINLAEHPSCLFGLNFWNCRVCILGPCWGTLYSELQMEAVFKDLTTSVYGNPRILLIFELWNCIDEFWYCLPNFGISIEN
ncbi:hypothetical protein SLA2020_281330 [Shorea laevis]